MDIRERAYETLLWVVIAIKVTWTIVDLFYLLARAIGRNDSRVTKLQILNEQTLNLAELLMNIILVLIFYPRRKTSDIKIDLGVLHRIRCRLQKLFSFEYNQQICSICEDGPNRYGNTASRLLGHS